MLLARRRLASHCPQVAERWRQSDANGPTTVTSAVCPLPGASAREISCPMVAIQQVAAAIITRDRRVLVTRRAPEQKMAGLWEFPGGKLEAGETVQTCIVRELMEELGITCEADDVLATNLHVYPGGAIELIGIRVRIISGALQLSVHDEARWVGSSELLALELAPADIPIAETVRTLLANQPTGAG